MGLRAKLDASKISRATLYKWQRKCAEYSVIVGLKVMEIEARIKSEAAKLSV
jgi:hypothetical protein